MKFKSILIYPPQAIPFQPYSSLPSLTGFLRAQGCKVEQRDVNIEAYDTLLVQDRLSRAAETIDRQLKSLEQQDHLCKREQKQIESLLKAQVSAAYVIDHIDEAKQATRDPAQFYDLGRCSWAYNILERGLELLSAEYYPTRWSLTDLQMQVMTQRPGPTLEKLMQAAKEERENIFLPFFRQEILPSILHASPNLLGLSITYPSQIVPALTLANLIKHTAPSIHICIGGARVAYDRLWTQRAVFSVVDSVIVGEGEHALLSLIQKLECGDQDLSDVPNLIYLRDDAIQRNTTLYLEDVNELPTPDWTGLPLKRYFSATFVPVLPTARGCYWGKCAFCTVSQSTARKYRPRRIELVLEDMRVLHEQHGATHFFLAADAEPPKRMQALAAKIKQQEQPFVWQCETRFSSSLTLEICRHIFEGGGRYFIFGLESACQRVLDLMNKGTTVPDIRQVISNCYQSGIAVNLQAFLGFPTESKEEARITADFMLTHQECIDSVSVGVFQLQPISGVDLDPGRYGVTKVDRESQNESDIVMSYDYEVDLGMPQSEVPGQLRHHFSRLMKYFLDPPAIASHLNAFLYVARYGSHTLKEKRIERLLRPDGLLDFRLRVPNRLGRRDFSFNGDQAKQAILFSPVGGDILVADAPTLRLLTMCDGQRSVDKVASEFATDADTIKGFIVGYSQALNRITRLCENGCLEIVP